MNTKPIASTVIAALALAASASQAQTAPETRFEFGLTTKSISEIRLSPERKNLYLVGEGAGKLTTQGVVVPVAIICGAVDTLVQGHPTVYAGVGDCELKSAAGGVGYIHFDTPQGQGDRARMTLTGGTQDLARFNGLTVPMIAIINPHVSGKPVFYFDTTDDKVIAK